MELSIANLVGISASHFEQMLNDKSRDHCFIQLSNEQTHCDL